MNRDIIHIHIPAFPVQAMRLARPEIRNRPVVIAPRSERALVLCASPEARKEGVFKGIAVCRAKTLCPSLMVAPPEPALTEKVFKEVVSVVSRYTPVWEASRPGHIYLDMTGTRRLWGRVKDTAYRIQKEIKALIELCSAAGIAGNKMVSGIASKLLRTEGMLYVNHGEEPSFMAPLKVGVIPGISRAHEVLLEQLDIFRVKELARLAIDDLKLIFSSKARVIQQRAFGIDPTPVYPGDAGGIVKDSLVLPEDTNDIQVLSGILFSLIERCARRLRRKNVLPRKAGLFVQYTDGMEVRRQFRLPAPSFWDFEIYPYFKKVFLDAYTRRTRIRFMSTWFHSFIRASQQLSLFEKPPVLQDKKRKLVQAIDQIRTCFGEKAIRYGILI